MTDLRQRALHHLMRHLDRLSVAAITSLAPLSDHYRAVAGRSPRG